MDNPLGKKVKVSASIALARKFSAGRILVGNECNGFAPSDLMVRLLFFFVAVDADYRSSLESRRSGAFCSRVEF